MWPSVPATVAVPMSLSASMMSLDGRVISDVLMRHVLFPRISYGSRLPVGDRAVAPFPGAALPRT